VSTLAVRQTVALGRRALLRTVRLPQAWVPSLFFPLVLMAIFSGSFGNAPGQVPGFPDVAGFLDFVIAGTILQATLIGGTTSGAAFAADIEGGFFDRLISSPVSRMALVLGRLVGNVTLAIVQALLFISVAVIFGARIADGLPGVAMVLLFTILLAIAAGGLGVTLGIRSGSAEAAQGSFPLFFALMFFSSAFFPRETMSGWFKVVADLNPISYVVEGMRVPITGVGTTTEMLFGLAVVTILAASALTASLMALTRRLRRGS
jgi:ABC-2 type transport system permease protein